MKSVTSNPFYKKKFFLDINGCLPDVEKNLVKDLKWLGAKEAFHCKDASFAVSNKAASLQNKPWAPMTANSSGHSPQLFSDCSLDLGSPEYTCSQVVDSKAVPLSHSRGKILLQKSQQIVKKHGTTDTLAVCKQYGVKVYHIDKVLSYIKKMKNFYSARKASNQVTQEIPVKKNLKKVSSTNDVLKIQAPFVKVEDINCQYRTRHRVFSSWSDIIDPALSQSVKDLHKNFMINGNVEHQALFRPILKDISVNNMSKGSPFLLPLTPSKSFTKQSTHASLAVSMISSTDNKKKTKVFPSADKKKKFKKKKQYCEICSVYYSNLDQHIENKSHSKFMDDAHNFRDLENLVAEFPKFSDVMQLNLQGYFNLELGFLPNSCRNLGDTSFAVPQAKPSNKINNLFSSESSDFATELYDLDDESIISATCSTASTGFVFLEDKWDPDISPEIPKQNIKSYLNIINKQSASNDTSVLDNFQITAESKFLGASNFDIFSNSDLELNYSSFSKHSNAVTGAFSGCLSIDKENSVVSLNQDDSLEFLAVPESFASNVSPNPVHFKSKKRKREDLETFRLKKFLHHISDPNISDEDFCHQNFSQSAKSYVHDYSRNKKLDLRNNLNLDVAIPISSICSLSDLCKQDKCNESPALSIDLLDVDKLFPNHTHSLDVKRSSHDANWIALETYSEHIDHLNSLDTHANENSAMNLNSKCCEIPTMTQIAYDSTTKCSQSVKNKVKDSFVITSKKEGKKVRKGYERLYLQNEKLLLRDSFIYFCEKEGHTCELILKGLLSISSQTYSSYYIGNLCAIYISQNQQQLSGNVVLRLNEASKNISMFTILNAYGKYITYKFIKQHLLELHHPKLRFISESLEKIFNVWNSSITTSDFSDGCISCSNSACCMSDSFICCNNPICFLKRDGVDLVEINLISSCVPADRNTVVDLSVPSNRELCKNIPLLPNDVERESNSFGDVSSLAVSKLSPCCSSGTHSQYGCLESESLSSEEEYIIVDSCSDGID